MSEEKNEGIKDENTKINNNIENVEYDVVKDESQKSGKVEKNKKINFLKKIYYSITKISKYDEMVDEGIKSAIKYFFIWIASIAIIPAIFTTYSQYKMTNQIGSYLDENLPELKINNNQLDVNDSSVCILDDDEFTNIIKYNIVINTNIEDSEEIKNEYSELVSKDTGCIVFGKTKAEVIQYNETSNENEESESEENISIREYKYEDYLKRYFSDTSKEYGKEDVVNYFTQHNIAYYGIQYYISYFLTLTVIIGTYIAIMSSVIFIITRIISTQSLKIKKLISMSIYATTLSNIVYLAYITFGYVFNKTVNYLDLVYLFIGCVYVAIFMSKDKLKVQHKI